MHGPQFGKAAIDDNKQSPQCGFFCVWFYKIKTIWIQFTYCNSYLYSYIVCNLKNRVGLYINFTIYTCEIGIKFTIIIIDLS